MLRVSKLDAFYGSSQVLRGLSLEIGPGEIVALLGRNGAGRSTLAKALMGLVGATGSVCWHGQEILGKTPHEIARLGLGYVPETRDVFPGLTVHDNLVLGVKPGAAAGPWSTTAVYDLFPALAARRQVRAGVLSGGEQQMLTLCRCLMGNPQLLIVDETTEGLSPQAVAQVSQLLLRLKAQGVAVLLIEQKLQLALTISQRCYLMGHGQVVLEGPASELLAQPLLCQEWLAL
jgi:branched-chain amino acid transport system ATP-binding protein